ncbi:DUF502 domain-containing protein [Halosimplex sp. TS25]|uniref:DUF502 domain-containing protein n=1 Tax=Halosimplex rarum TaxID=3396619 RepID=UPI0039EC4405
MVLLSSAPASGESGPTLGGKVRQILISGAALTIPLVVTVMILVFVINFILQAITPVVLVINEGFGIGQDVDDLTMKLLAIATFVGMVFVLGLVAETRSGNQLERVFDTAMARIPGIGSLYTSFNEMTELLLSNDAESFREVKLVEFPRSESYSLAFVTAESPPTIADTTGHEDMTTLFMPMAPNPVMGGYVIHVSSERVYDVDLTVEEGIRSIVTSGVATGDSDAVDGDREIASLEAIREQARDGVHDLGNWGTQTAADLSDFTGKAAGDIREQAYHEFAALHPDLDASELEDEEEVRHYMLDEFGTEEGHENTVSSRPGDGDGSGDDGRPVDGDPTDGDRPSGDGDRSGGRELDGASDETSAGGDA